MSITNESLSRFIGGQARLWNFSPSHDHLAILLIPLDGPKSFLVLSGCERIELSTGWTIKTPRMARAIPPHYDFIDDDTRVRCVDAGLFAEYERW